MAFPKVFRGRASFAALVTLLAVATASPVALPAQPQDPPGQGLTWQVQGNNPGEINCETDRSSDYYGLGVRLGIYMAWLTGWIANNWVPEEIAGAMDTNAIFLFALVIAVVRCTSTDLVSQMDGVMLMHLAGGTIFSVISIWGYRTCWYTKEGPRGIANFGGFGTHLRLLLCMAVSTYGLWFWYFGMAGSLKSGTGACQVTWTFFFAKLRADGGIRKWYIFKYVVCLIYFGIMTAVSIIGPISRIMKMAWLARYKFFRTSSRLKYATGYTYGELRGIFAVLRFTNFFWIIFSMVTCEFTLNYNHVQSVLGENGRIFFPSQLIPLVIGASSLIRVVYIGLEEWRAPGDHRPSLEEAPTEPRRPNPLPRRRDLFKLFAPTSADERASSPITEDGALLHFENSDVDEEMIGKPRWCRYLVSYLPWLQAAIQWWRIRNEPENPTADSRQLEHAHEPRLPSDLEKATERRRETWSSDDTLTAVDRHKSLNDVL
ncbi:hypothetical protein NA57DRAFT_72194 [Rhizodiscina lignyota]|uniref:Uncharacterized protein n=1 Tax=Rhizodiscina lignyota TaxID=1504668 RepID=A0A9P4IL87_9PEZI|nr:hypothetical protein NA57DRAFT_72194 [Rhizodiscina lignyota]